MEVAGSRAPTVRVKALMPLHRYAVARYIVGDVTHREDLVVSRKIVRTLSCSHIFERVQLNRSQLHEQEPEAKQDLV
jgi:hypothetical protein